MTTETAESQRSRARLARQAMPRRLLGEFTHVQRDPVELVQSRDEGRLENLVPLRHSRMAASEFAFFRGSAALMAHDLAHQNQTDTHLVICGDAHINNFGLYASPERRLVFDLNDFDEAAPGPWEWDVKRLLTSAVLAAREINASESQIEDVVLSGAKQYREHLQHLLELPSLERHYVSVDSTALAAKVRDGGLKSFNRTTKKARKRDSDRAIAHLMSPDRMGFVRFKDDPPILTHPLDSSRQELEDMLDEYRSTALPEINFLLDRYQVTDVALRVVGVGSVGTRCYLAALTGPEGTGLVLQVKEADHSVVSEYAAANETTPMTLAEGDGNGARVVVHQRILQAVSDSFLGHLDRGDHSFYVRQYRDAKGSFDTTTMDLDSFKAYVVLCSTMLARAHAQSPLAHWVGAYIGSGSNFEDAMLSWSRQYADQVSDDFRQYKQAIADGRVSVMPSEEIGDGS